MIAIFVVGVITVMAGVAFVASQAVLRVKAPIDAANRYLDAVTRDDYQTAYGMVCHVAPRESYEQYVEALQAQARAEGHLRSHDVISANTSGSRAAVLYDTRTDTGTDERRALMVKENGHWTFCGAQSTRTPNH